MTADTPQRRPVVPPHMRAVGTLHNNHQNHQVRLSVVLNFELILDVDMILYIYISLYRYFPFDVIRGSLKIRGAEMISLNI